MPAWPGGECPQCGEHMPPALVHCQNCRVLLNSELRISSVDIPEFFPLREIPISSRVQTHGYYIQCPHCDQELRIARKYEGEHVRCKFCTKPFRFDLAALGVDRYMAYADCPHCSKELKMSNKYLGMEVACKICSGHIQLMTD